MAKKTKSKKIKSPFSITKVLIFILLFVILAIIVMTFSTPSRADNYSTDFEAFNLGSVAQDGWKVNGSVNQAIEEQNLYTTFGAKSLRIGNGAGKDSANFVLSNLVVNSAGEIVSGAAFGSGAGLIQPNFKAEWDFSSANPETVQTNLILDARMDEAKTPFLSTNVNGMSKIEMSDTATGLKVKVGDLDHGLVTIAENLDRSIPHHIKITINFVDGPSNDVVTACVDNDLSTCKTVGSYEGLYGTPLVVRGVAFRPQTTLSGPGFYIDNFSMLSWGNEPTAVPTEVPVPTDEPTVAPSETPVPTEVEPSPTNVLIKPPKNLKQCKNDNWKNFNNPAFPNQGQCIKYVLKNEWRELKNQEEAKWDIMKDKIERDWSN